MANHLDLEEQEQIDQLKHFWNTWGTLISAVALAVALGLAGWNGYQFWQNRQAGQAAALLDAVDAAAAGGDMGRLEQAFADMRSKFGGTAQAGLAGLAVGKTASSAGNAALAKAALTWVAESAKDDGHKAIARLRLSALLTEEKSYDEALKQLSGPFAAEYAAVVADRKGDVLVLLGKKQEAVDEYSRAYQAFSESMEYRSLVEVKLNALGVKASSLSTKAVTEATK
ncbi:MAG: tetratricopeptide repeat protein [Giesbergeria sp.]|nr:tetratricopeptide repeat protein [Giesbergeria sp.]